MIEGRPRVFDQVVEFPNPDAHRRYEQLVGLDDIKERLLKESSVLLNPSLLEDWSRRHYRRVIELSKIYRDRPPLFLFVGDVGNGKSALAKSFGDAMARRLDIATTLLSLSLTARGSGAVGEMTTLLSMAFEEVKALASAGKPASNGAGAAFILLIDEADALAQSREFSQMHHEDRAGVNTLIRGIDDLTGCGLPLLIVMCSNRGDSVDPAVKRRAAGIFRFDRPDDEERRLVLERALGGVDFTAAQLDELTRATGRRGSRRYGFTYSDLTQRLLPEVLLDAFPERRIEFGQCMRIAEALCPTSPFAAFGVMRDEGAEE